MASKDLFVKAPLVIAKNEDGTDRYLYGGGEGSAPVAVPDGLDKDDVKRLTDEGYFGPLDDSKSSK